MNKTLLKKFDVNKKENTFSRIDEYHAIDVFVGYLDNNPTIAIRGSHNRKKIISTKYIKVRIKDEENKIALLSFSLIDISMFNIFIQFCDDIIHLTEGKDSKNILDIVIERWECWKKMFNSGDRKILSEQSIRGLIGELLFLEKYMIAKYGDSYAIKSWIGPELADKDFEINDLWYEIKTVTSNALTVKISSIQQLDSYLNGYLVVINLDSSNNTKGTISLNYLVDRIKNKLTSIDDRLLFVSKLLEIGYSENDEYNKYSYIITGIGFYMVNNEFPKIKKTDLKEGIVNTNYEISLQYINKFKKEVDIYGFEGI